MVREERVELSTFGSGDLRYILILLIKQRLFSTGCHAVDILAANWFTWATKVSNANECDSTEK